MLHPAVSVGLDFCNSDFRVLPPTSTMLKWISPSAMLSASFCMAFASSCCNKEEKDKEVYVGETSRNVYTRALEHMKNTDEDSFMNKHMREHHPGEEKDFKAKVIRTNKESLTRQVWEGVQIRREKRKLMNTKSEWFQPPLFKVQSEIIRE